MEYITKTERVMNLMLLLGLNEALDQLAMANSFHLHGHV